MGDGTSIPEELIPRCPVCGAEAFPWVRGYGNFLQGRKYEEQYQKISKYIMNNKEKKILFLELGVGRMTPMWYLMNGICPSLQRSLQSAKKKGFSARTVLFNI